MYKSTYLEEVDVITPSVAAIPTICTQDVDKIEAIDDVRRIPRIPATSDKVKAGRNTAAREQSGALSRRC